MAVFEYEAINADGSKSKGTVNAGAIGLASTMLKQRGLNIVRLSQAASPPPPLTGAAHPLAQASLTAGGPLAARQTNKRPSGRKPSLSEHTFFFQRMRSLLLAG